MESAQNKTFRLLNEALDMCRLAKPNDRSAQDRAYAIIITDLEKTIAYMDYWILGGTGVKMLP